MNTIAYLQQFLHNNIISTIGVSLILIFFIVIFMNEFFTAIKNYKLVKNLSTISSGGIHEGLIAIKGTIASTHDNLLKAPVTGNDCYWYEFEVEQYNAPPPTSGITVTIRSENDSQPKSATWETIRTGRADNFFILDVGAKQYIVATHGAEVTVANEQTLISDDLPNIPFTQQEQKAQEMFKAVGKMLPMQNRTLYSTSNTTQYKSMIKSLTANETITVLGNYAKLTSNDIEEFIRAEKEKKKWLQKWPTKKDILIELKDYMLRSNKDSIELISISFKGKQPYLISSLSGEPLKSYYIKTVVVLLFANLFLISLFIIFIINLF